MRGACHRAGDLELDATIVCGLLAVATEIPGNQHALRLAGLGDQAHDALEVEDVFFTSARNVDRVARRCGWRQHFGERRRQMIAKPLDLEPVSDEAISGERDVTATVASDCDAATTRWGRWEQGLEEIDHLKRRLHAIHSAGLAGSAARDQIPSRRPR